MSKAIPIKYDYRGKQWTINELAQIAKVDKATLQNRLGRQRWSVERAVETPRISRSAAGRISAQKLECRISIEGNYLPPLEVQS